MRGVAIGRLKSSSVGVFTLVIAELVPIGGGADKQTKEFLCCSVFEWGTKKASVAVDFCV